MEGTRGGRAATMDRNNHSRCVMTVILIFFSYLTVPHFFITLFSAFPNLLLPLSQSVPATGWRVLATWWWQRLSNTAADTERVARIVDSGREHSGLPRADDGSGGGFSVLILFPGTFQRPQTNIAHPFHRTHSTTRPWRYSLCQLYMLGYSWPTCLLMKAQWLDNEPDVRITYTISMWSNITIILVREH